jgi:hypothetical protein
VTAPNNDKFKDYARYAEHCLNMVAATTDRESRSIQREMAAEWLRLADEMRRPRKRKQMQMQMQNANGMMRAAASPCAARWSQYR